MLLPWIKKKKVFSKDACFKTHSYCPKRSNIQYSTVNCMWYLIITLSAVSSAILSYICAVYVVVFTLWYISCVFTSLSGELICFMVNQVRHTSSIMKARVMIESFQGLTRAVGFLGGYAAFVVVQWGGGELQIFPTAAVGQCTVPALLQIHDICCSPMIRSVYKVEVSTAV